LATLTNVGCIVAIKSCFDVSRPIVFCSHGQQRAAAANAFGINVGVFFRHAFLLQRRDDAANRAAGDCTGCRTCCGRGQPTRRNNWTQTRNGEEAKTGKEARASA
jgi:hypothetical protein